MLRLASNGVVSALRNGRRPFSRFPVIRWSTPSLESPFERMERQLDNALRSFPVWSNAFRSDRLVDLDSFSILNPIIEEDGVQKFKIEFDVSNFKPEEVKIKTSEKDKSISIEASHEGGSSSFHLTRTFTVPDGTKLDELKCSFMAEGSLVMTAPYEAPANKPSSQTPRQIEIPVERG